MNCRTLIDVSVAIEPHLYLEIYGGTISEHGHTQYYDCRKCGAELVRKQMDSDPSMRWQLLSSAPPLLPDERLRVGHLVAQRTPF